MRRALCFAAGLVTLGAARWLRCKLRGRGHRPKRHFLGGFRCADCGATGADLEAMGFDGAYVLPIRIVYDREHGQITRSQRW